MFFHQGVYIVIDINDPFPLSVSALVCCHFLVSLVVDDDFLAVYPDEDTFSRQVFWHGIMVVLEAYRCLLVHFILRHFKTSKLPGIGLQGLQFLVDPAGSTRG